MESDVKRTQRDYTRAFKVSVVDQIEKGELTYKEAQRRYGIIHWHEPTGVLPRAGTPG